jgi:hypothetical protein
VARSRPRPQNDKEEKKGGKEKKKQQAAMTTEDIMKDKTFNFAGTPEVTIKYHKLDLAGNKVCVWGRRCVHACA